MTANTLAVEVRNLSFTLGGRQILDSVSFDVHSGDYLHIIGPNGAGKTTLLKCLVRIHKTKELAIWINGCCLQGQSQRHLARQIGYVPQSAHFSLGCTAYEFVAMGRYPYLKPFSGLLTTDHSAVERALDLTQTTALAERSVCSLSGGERQKVFIAAAIAQDAKILLLDEPATFLDPLHQAHVQELLYALHKECGLTLIVVTHDINSAALYGQRTIALKNGRLVFNGSVAQLMADDTLEKIYDKPFVFASHPVTGQRLVLPDGVSV